MTHTIPVELCVLAIRERHIPELRLFLHLKFKYRGYFRKTRGTVTQMANELGLSEKTIFSQLENLLSRGWMNGNRVTKVFWIVSYKRIAHRYDFISSKACILPTHWVRKGSFRTLIFAVVIGYWANRKPVRRGLTRSALRAKEPPPGFRPLANKYMEKVLGAPHSTIVRHKLEADRLGYITLRTKSKETRYGDMDIASVRENNPRIAHLLRTENGIVVQCLPSEVRAELKYKNCGRLKKGKKWTQ